MCVRKKKMWIIFYVFAAWGDNKILVRNRLMVYDDCEHQFAALYDFNGAKPIFLCSMAYNNENRI